MKAKKILTKALGWLTADGVTTKIIDGKLAVVTGIEVNDGVASVHVTDVKVMHDESAKSAVNEEPYVTPFELNAKLISLGSYTLTITDVSVIEPLEEETSDASDSETKEEESGQA
jgi:hypothetical protein